MVTLSLHHEAEVSVSASQIRVESIVELNCRAGSGGSDRIWLGECLGEPVRLIGHFRVPLEDMPSSLVWESDLVSLLICEALHTGLRRLLLFRKIYRQAA